MSTKKMFWLTLFCLCFLGWSSGTASAQQRLPTPSDDEVNAIAGMLTCPVCNNVPLDVCATPACIQWRELIRQQLIEGRSSVDIKQTFVEQFGEQVLVDAPRHGMIGIIDWLVWGLLLLGSGYLIRFFPGIRRPASEGVQASLDSLDPYVERVEAELQSYQKMGSRMHRNE